MKTLDKVLILVGGFLAAFIVATVIIYTVNGWPYDVLIPCVVGSGVLETVNTMIITVNKIRRGSYAAADTGSGGFSADSNDLGTDLAPDAGESLETDIF